jgi:hypothetical protein
MMMMMMMTRRRRRRSWTCDPQARAECRSGVIGPDWRLST